MVRASLTEQLRRSAHQAGKIALRYHRRCSISSIPRSRHRALGDSLTLNSGRVLGYHVSGPVNGVPVTYIHGHPDSGLTITGKLEKQVADQLNVRWIGPDRPGVGHSTQHDDHTVEAYPSDIEALAAHLDLREYYILGTSGGTGFALACAKNLPRSQLKGVGICAGIGPVECGFESMDDHQRQALEAWRDHPKEFREYYETTYVPLARHKDSDALANKLRDEFEKAFVGEDRTMMLQDDNFSMAVDVFRQCWNQGAWAHAKGMELHWNPWGFALEEVDFPGIKLWYGEKDVSTTPVMGRYMAKRLTGSIYREFSGLSHYWIWCDGPLQVMLRDLLGQ